MQAKLKPLYTFSLSYLTANGATITPKNFTDLCVEVRKERLTGQPNRVTLIKLLKAQVRPLFHPPFNFATQGSGSALLRWVQQNEFTETGFSLRVSKDLIDFLLANLPEGPITSSRREEVPHA